jgi:DNA-binding CsgD family transcriptional regulator
VVAGDADLWWRHGPRELAEVLLARRGRAYDPNMVDACSSVAPRLLAQLDQGDVWEAMLSADPSEDALEDAGLDRALSAIADFADLKSPWTRGHSPRVADAAAAAADALGLGAEAVAQVRRAALVHDLGRVGVPNGIWDRAAPLGIVEWERVRMHPYLTESTLAYCQTLADLGRLAGAHHERRDGSGYHRGRSDMTLPEGILAAADAIVAMSEDRPHRPALSKSQIAATVQAEISAGRFERSVADAVLSAAGHEAAPARRASWPAGLSDREVEVLCLVARGRTNKEVAASLYLSIKTVGRHIEKIYNKISVNSRAAAAVFAMEHRLLDS